MTKKTSPTQKMLFWWGLILICWSAYRFKFGTELGIFFDEFIAKPLVFVLPVIFYVRRFEKINLWEGLGFRSKEIAKEIILGLCTGAVFFIILFVSFPFNVLSSNFQKIVSSHNIGLVLLTAFATSICEEILSRGFVLKRLYDESKNILTSSFFASILFFFLRVPILFSNDKIMGTTLIAMMIIEILFSLAVSFVFLARRNIILPILIHAFYILMLYLTLGFS